MIASGRPYPVPFTAGQFPGWRNRPLRGEVNDGNAAHALGGVAGHAGLFATVGDLLRLGAAVRGGDFIPAPVLARFAAPVAVHPEQAVGFRRARARLGGAVLTVLYHGGFTGTYFAFGLEDELRRRRRRDAPVRHPRAHSRPTAGRPTSASWWPAPTSSPSCSRPPCAPTRTQAPTRPPPRNYDRDLPRPRQRPGADHPRPQRRLHHRPRRGGGGPPCQPRRGGRRDRRDRRRVRLGQVHPRRVREPAAGRERPHHRRHHHRRRSRHHRRQREGHDRHPRQPDRPGPAGPDDQPQPGDEDRRPDRRGARGARPGARSGRQGRGHPAARPGGHRRPGGAVSPVPARVLRRHAPAGADRDGAGLPTGGAAGGRAHLGPRRDRATAGARPDGAARLRPGRGRAADHARPRPGGRAGGPRRGDAPRRDRRVRPGRPARRQPAARVHPPPAGRRPRHGEREDRARSRGRRRRGRARGAARGHRRGQEVPDPRPLRAADGRRRG